jgi:hypothetical protein
MPSTGKDTTSIGWGIRLVIWLIYSWGVSYGTRAISSSRPSAVRVAVGHGQMHPDADQRGSETQQVPPGWRATLGHERAEWPRRRRSARAALMRSLGNLISDDEILTGRDDQDRRRAHRRDAVARNGM